MKRITVKDLARELGVSLGTINKALNNKPGLSDETRKKIIETSQLMGYKINRVAQSLARKAIQIGIILPEVWPEYYSYLKVGINQELERLSDFNIRGRYYNVPNLQSGKETIEALKNCVHDGMDAVIFCPNYDTDYIDYLNELHDRGIQLVILGSDINEVNRLCSVRVDAYKAGRLAAEFMGWIVGENKSVAVFIGNKDYREHKDKVEGFMDEAKNQSYNIVGAYETHDDREIAYFMTDKLMREKSDLGGIYVATGNSIAVCKYLSEHNKENVSVVATDIYKEVADLMKQDAIQGIIFQDQIAQGIAAVKVIYNKLVNNTDGLENILITPQLVLKSNVESYISGI